MTSDDPEDFFDHIQAASQDFQERDLGGFQCQGLVGYHTLFSHDAARDDLTTAYPTVLHVAIDELLDKFWIDEDIILDQHGEVTPETIGRTVAEQFDEYARWNFADRLGDEVARQLRDFDETLREDDDE